MSKIGTNKKATFFNRTEHKIKVQWSLANFIAQSMLLRSGELRFFQIKHKRDRKVLPKSNMLEMHRLPNIKSVSLKIMKFGMNHQKHIFYQDLTKIFI